MKSVLTRKIAVACAVLTVVAGILGATAPAPSADTTAGPASGGTNFPTVARARV